MPPQYPSCRRVRTRTAVAALAAATALVLSQTGPLAHGGSAMAKDSPPAGGVYKAPDSAPAGGVYMGGGRKIR